MDIRINKTDNRIAASADGAPQSPRLPTVVRPHKLKATQKLIVTGTLLALGVAASAEDVNFSRDVLPLLSDRCFHCHGPDEENRKADLRLDLESQAKVDSDAFGPISPGNLSESEVWNRINSTDQNELMPPPDSHRKPLSAKEKATIQKWILDGARWGKHWSFERPVKAAVPDIAKHPIDAFIRQALKDKKIAPSERAPVHTQLRRLSFSLIGMAPTPEELKLLEKNPSNENWNSTIERLLASPHHAERMAMWWLDAARYSDSDGFQGDATRQNWPWRDWVISAFQKNMSFDDFTIEQFAGDLLPNSTAEQILATCFHRNHMTNGEGGRDPEESRIDYVIDRVNTTGTVWLGLTLGCTQCHTHKFDPITHHDYYSMTAFFNSIDENGKAGMGATPYLKYQSKAVTDRVEELTRFVDACESEESLVRKNAEKRFENWLKETVNSDHSLYQTWSIPEPTATSSDGSKFRIESENTIQTFGPSPRQDDYHISLPIPEGMTQISGWRLEVFPNNEHVDGRFSREGNGEFVLTSVRALLKQKGTNTEKELEISKALADVEANPKRKSKLFSDYSAIAKTLNDDARNGWTTEGVKNAASHIGVFALEKTTAVQHGDQFVILLRHRSNIGNANIGRFRLSITSEAGETVARVDGKSPMSELSRLSTKDIGSVPSELRSRLLKQFLLTDVVYQAHLKRLNTAKQQLNATRSNAKPRSVMVLRERKDARTTHVLVRGVWDAKGDEVKPAMLPSILKWPEEKSQSRLDLAKWIVDRQNPLTARVVVNHLWQIMFGEGIVRTPGDFGLQGEFPTHPKLLDWLAVELMEKDWDLRHILKLIATSETYRQSSNTTAQLLAVDPQNRMLARASRFRLPAWMIRDNGLRVSNLLNSAIGGPPVYPYQPDGVWSENTMGRFRYQPSLGPAQYRRTLYAYWRRSSAPTFLFDNAQRRVCEVSTRRTNTPLHALTLMNNNNSLEAARVLADKLSKPNGDSIPKRIGILATRILSRTLSKEELHDIESVFQTAYDYYKLHTADATRFTIAGQQRPVDEKRVAETAAWMTIANLMLNLDEAITCE